MLYFLLFTVYNEYFYHEFYIFSLFICDLWQASYIFSFLKSERMNTYTYIRTYVRMYIHTYISYMLIVQSECSDFVVWSKHTDEM